MLRFIIYMKRKISCRCNIEVLNNFPKSALLLTFFQKNRRKKVPLTHSIQDASHTVTPLNNSYMTLTVLWSSISLIIIHYSYYGQVDVILYMCQLMYFNFHIKRRPPTKPPTQVNLIILAYHHNKMPTSEQHSVSSKCEAARE